MGKRRKREDFDAYLKELRNKLLADNGDGLAFLVEETHSPTRERLRGELEKNLPGMRWCVYEPLSSQGTIAATQMRSALVRARSPDSIAPMSSLRWTAIFSIAARAISRQCAHLPRGGV